jgi:hypothetical protein
MTIRRLTRVQIGFEFFEMTTERELVIPTLAGVRYAAPGDWIIRGALGEIYPCKPHAFEATYDAVRE